MQIMQNRILETNSSLVFLRYFSLKQWHRIYKHTVVHTSNLFYSDRNYKSINLGLQCAVSLIQQQCGTSPFHNFNLQYFFNLITILTIPKFNENVFLLGRW